ncbi:unnamed protein product [Ambrosiozyma monospora]|uniref:Unnamed protein product n=1 Tax=Ambrosiozyma monospora TaxID=43982 RepID=A0A9W7DHL7_AMBMO|nr:unnamed protein product [Ambrosiozyma monospora]
MVVNLNGDVSRGTISLDSYPTSLAVDFPYTLSVFGDTHLKVYSLHDQKQYQTVEFPDNSKIKLKSVSHIFDLKDSTMSKNLTKIPIISKMTDDDIERTVVECDVGLENSSIKSSCLLFDEIGSTVRLLKPQTRIDRVLSIYRSANERTFQLVFDELLDELKQDKDGKRGILGIFTLSLSALLPLKFFLFDQCFEVWCGNFKYLDPRILLYVMCGGDNIYGSVWEFQGLVELIEELRVQFASCDEEKQNQVQEFLKVFLNTILGSKSVKQYKNDKEAVLKTAEVQLLNLSLKNGNLESVLKHIKYSSNETIEILLEHKQFYYLAKFYEGSHNSKQFLYYWKGLITGELKDAIFDRNCSTVGKPLKYLVNHLVANCSDDSALMWKYSEWLLTDHPKYGFDLLTDKHLQKLDINDIKVLNILKNEEDIKSEYLKHMLVVKNEKQFTGDLIMSEMNKLVRTLREDVSLGKRVEEVNSKYLAMSLPKITIYKYWELEKNRLGSQYLPGIIETIYKYLLTVNKDTVSVLGRVNVLNECLRVLLEDEFRNKFTFLLVLLYAKKIDYKQVVIEYCSIQDFISAEHFANKLMLPSVSFIDSKAQYHENSEPFQPEQRKISETLLMQIFDVYLKMNNGLLIESFLNNYNLLQDDSENLSSSLEKMDKFSEFIERIPDSFPLAQLNRFLSKSLIDFQDHSNNLLLQKNLARSYRQDLNTFLNSLEDSVDTNGTINKSS